MVSAQARAQVTRQLDPGEVYFLRGGVGFGIAVGRPTLEFVSQAQGEPELRKLKLLPPSEN